MLSLAYITVDHSHPLEHIRAAGEAGFDAVGLRALQPTGRALDHAMIGDPALVRAIVEECRARRIAVLDLEVATLSPAFDLDALLPLLDLGAQIDAQYVQIVGEDPDLDRAADNLARFAEAAQMRRLKVALEFMRFRATSDLPSARAMLARAAHPAAALLVDALHLARSGGTAEDLAALRPAEVAYFQLCDAPAEHPADGDYIAEARIARLYPAEGGLPLGAMLRSLPAGIPISVEVPHGRLSGASVADRATSAFAWTRRFFTDADMVDRLPGQRAR